MSDPPHLIDTVRVTLTSTEGNYDVTAEFLLGAHPRTIHDLRGLISRLLATYEFGSVVNNTQQSLGDFVLYLIGQAALEHIENI